MVMQEEQSMGFMNDFGSYVSLDKTATITLPTTATFSDAKCTIEQGGKESQNIAELVYTYGGKMVGSVAIVASGVTVGDTYFSENANQVDTEAQIVKIKPVYLILAVLSLIALVIIIILARKLYENYYLLLHNQKIRKQRQSRFRPVNRKRESIRRRRSRRFR
jgi:Na+/melibiose symporter-like transporter